MKFITKRAEQESKIFITEKIRHRKAKHNKNKKKFESR